MPRDRRDAMIEQLRQEIPAGRLVAAMAAVLQARRERAGLDPNNFDVPNPMQQLDGFLKSCNNSKCCAR